MATLKVGLKLRSAVCSTEVIVVKSAGQATLSCGGTPMLGSDEAPPGGAVLRPDPAGGCKIGKRYVNAEQTLEVLCVKAGRGGLDADGIALQAKEAKPLPSSD